MSAILTKITSALSGDIVFLLVTFVVIFLCAMYFGRNRIVSLILAFYPATLLYNSFPFINKFIVLSGDRAVVINKIGIFLVFFILVNLAINKYVALYDESSSTFRKGGLAFAVLILFLLFSYTIVNFDVFHNFSSSIDVLFQGETRIFWWSLTPLIILWFV
ncbi:MAG: hypothetical protein NTX96_02140 [Candidatus Zambryskibacteria bacterium]|nr:hypothetical protein [Candidatus Zambryskibacteria bacterium]